MAKKECSECNENKDSNCFHKNKKSPDGLDYKCKQCKKKINHERYLKNKEKIKERNRKWKEENKERWKEYCKEYNKKRYWNNREEILENYKEWYQNNKEKRNKYKRQRRKNNKGEQIKHNLRCRLSNLTSKRSNSKTLISLLGLSIEEFRTYLERQFDENMTWDNYGNYWHIDHIIPLDYFDHENPYEVEEAWFYTNLQPLEAKENIRKGNKI